MHIYTLVTDGTYPQVKSVSPARKNEKLFIAISIHLTASAAAKAVLCWSAGALAQASTAR